MLARMSESIHADLGQADAALTRPAARRVAWADLAKGWSILLVVIMHSTLGVGAEIGETGWLHRVVAFAKPFRMPDFFLVAGLFAAVAVDKPWRVFFDKRVLHFVYFYVLWAAIIILLKVGVETRGDVAVMLRRVLLSLWIPYSSLWFIYVLPAMFLTVRLARRLPAWLVLAVAAAAHVLAETAAEPTPYAMASHLTGRFAIDSYLLFVVFFLVGHYAREPIFRLAAAASARPGAAGAGLAVWAALHAAAVVAGLTDKPGVTLAAGLAGALAVVVTSAVLARFAWMGWLAAIGRKSLVVYLSFAIPMVITREALIRSGLVADVGWISAATSAFALLMPLAVARFVAGTPLAFLYTRPQWARLALADPAAQPRAASDDSRAATCGASSRDAAGPG